MSIDGTDASLTADRVAGLAPAEADTPPGVPPRRAESDPRRVAAGSGKRPRTRDRSIDVLRGWAIVLMITSHIGAASRVSMLVNAHRWVDAAGPFVILAGLVLGMMVSSGKPERAVWSRARQLWVIHVVMMFAVVAIHEATGRLNSPSVADAGGLASVLWKVPALRLQALDYMNILPLFVMFFFAAPPLLAAMKRGMTALVFGGSFALWAFTQHSPGWFRFTDAASGPESFVLPAWQFPFVIGLVVGFHGRSLARSFWPKNAAWFVPLTTAMVFVLFVVAQFQRKALLRFGAELPPSSWWLFGKETWAPARGLYTVGMLLVGYVGLEWLRKHHAAWFAPTRYLELMGASSLYCFLVHLPLALLASAVSLGAWSPALQDLAAAGALVSVYALARHQVLARYIPS